jgi:hypothetical protein
MDGGGLELRNRTMLEVFNRFYGKQRKMWKLYLDDLRDPSYTYGEALVPGEQVARHLESPRQVGFAPALWVVARSTEEAKKLVLDRGMPEVMSLDHDLGDQDRAMDFLTWLANEYWDGTQPIPMVIVHSANPIEAENLRSFADSWKRSVG